MEGYQTIDQTSFEQVLNLKKTEDYKELIDHFTNSKDEGDFLNKLEKYTQEPWERSQDILLVWVPVLNKIQEILKQVITEHRLDIHIPELNNYPLNTKTKAGLQQLDSNTTTTKLTYDAFLTHLPIEVERKLIKLLDFTFFILQNTTNRFNYSSTDQILALLNAPNIEIKLRCVKILLLDIGESLGPWNPDKNVKAELRTKSSAIILALQCHISSDSILKNSFDLVDFLSNYSPKSYGIPENATLVSPANTILPFTFKYYSEKNNNNLEVFKITNEKLLSTSYEELLYLIKSQNKIPEHYWFEISMQLYVAKAFAVAEDDNASKIQTNFLLAKDTDKLQQIFDAINPYIQLKFYTVGLINALLSPPVVSSSIFELDGSIFECLCRIILQAYPLQKVPDNFSLNKIRISALYALKFISDRHVWCLDILKCVGGNATHGAVFLLLDRMRNAIAEKSDDIDVVYNMRFFDVISNLTSVSSISDSLVSAGLIYKLTDILKVPDYHEYQTLLKVSDVLKSCIKTIDNVNVFENAGGYKLLHDRLSTEIEYGLATKDQFKHIKHYTEIFFTLSFRQVCYIRSLLKHILKVIDIDTTDKIRNFMDSQLLSTLNVMLLNRQDFGFTLLSYVLDIVQVLLNKDPTIYQVLQEAGTIDIIVNNFADYLGPWANLLLTLPQLVSALCLNKSALKKIKESNIIKLLFQPYRDAKLAAVLIKYMESEYAENLDELYRYHPDLQEKMTEEFADAINSLDIKYDQQPFMQPIKGTLFENNQETFEGTAICSDYSFDSTESGMLLRCAFLSLYGCEWTNLNKKLDCSAIIRKIYNEKTPAIFLKSDTQVAVVDVLKSSELFDFDSISLSFTSTVIKLLKDLEKFKVGYENKSFFLSCTDEKEIQNYLGLLNSLSVNFQTLINIGFEYGTFSDRKCKEFVNSYLKHESSEEEIFTAMSNLFIKLILEENQIARQLTPQQDANTLNQKPYLITLKKDLKMKKEKFNDYFTNNVFMVRHWCSNISYNIVLFFKSFLRIFAMERISLDADILTDEVRVMEFSMKALVNIANYFNKDDLPVDETLNAVFLVYSALKKQPFGYQGISSEIDYFVCNLYYKYKMNVKLFELMEKAIQNHVKLADQKDFEFYDVKSKFVFERNDAVLVPKYIQLLFEVTNWANKSYLSIKQEALYSKVMLCVNKTPAADAELFTKYMLQSDLECIKHMQTKYFDKATIYKQMVFTDKTFVKIIDCYVDVVKRSLSFFDCQNHISNIILYLDSLNTCTMSGLTNILKNRLGNDVDVSNSLEEAKNYLFTTNDDESSEIVGVLPNLKYFGEDKHLKSDDLKEWYNKCCNYVLPPNDDFHLDGKIFAFNIWDKSMSTANHVCSFKSFDGIVFDSKSIIELVILYPKCIGSIYTLLRTLVETYKSNYGNDSSYLSYEKDSGDFVTDFGHITASFVQYLQTNFKKISWDKKIPLLQFVGLLLSKPLRNDIDVDELIVIGDCFALWFAEDFTSNNVSSDWLPAFLYVFETLYNHFRYLSLQKIHNKNTYESFDYKTFKNFDSSFVQSVLKVVLNYKNIKTIELGSSIARICILHILEDPESRGSVVNSKILVELLKCIGLSQKDKLVDNLQTTFIILCRLCLEDHQVIRSVMIKDALTMNETLQIFNHRKSFLIFRDPVMLTKVLYEQGFDFKRGSFVDESEEIELEIYRKSRNNKNVDQTPMKTDIISLLFSQLIATFKTDWITENETANNGNFEIKSSNNISFNYMKFLLNILTELILSYQQAKFDLMNYSKRNVYGQLAEPRSTSINFLIHHLLPFAKFTVTIKRDVAEEKKQFLYKKAKILLQHLLINKNAENNQLHRSLAFDKSDHAFVFIRKHVLQCLVKVIHPDRIKTSHQTLSYTEKEKIYGCLLFLRDLFLSFSHLKRELVMVLKLVIQLNIPNLLSLLLNRLDNSLISNVSELNIQIFVCLKSFHNIIDENSDEFIDSKPLHNLINEHSESGLLSKDSNSAKNIEDHDSSSDSSDDEEKEETNNDISDVENDEDNMFRHSALAMYDIEDIEEEVMNNQNSIFDEEFDEEDLAFVDDAALQDSLDILDGPATEHLDFVDYSDEDENDENGGESDVDMIHGDVILDDLHSQTDSRSENEFDSDDEEGVIYLDNDIVLLDDDEDNENFVEDPLGYEVDAEEFNAHIDQRDLYESDFVSGMNNSSSDDNSSLRDDSDFTDYSDYAQSDDDSINLSGTDSSQSEYSSSEDEVAQYIIDDHNANLVDSSMRPRQHRNSFMIDIDNGNIASDINADASSALNMIARRFSWSAIPSTIVRNNRSLGHVSNFDLFAPDRGYNVNGYNASSLSSNVFDNILGSNEAHQRFNHDEIESDETPVRNKPLFLSNANIDILFEDESVSTVKRWEEIQRMFPLMEFCSENMVAELFKHFSDLPEFDIANIRGQILTEKKIIQNQSVQQNQKIGEKRKAELDLNSEVLMFDDKSLIEIDGHVLDTKVFGLNADIFKDSKSNEDKKEKLFEHIANCLINQQNYVYSSCPPDLWKLNDVKNTADIDYKVVNTLPESFIEEIEDCQREKEKSLSLKMKELFEKGRSVDNSVNKKHRSAVLYDRYAIYSLSKSFFIYQPYLKREPFHEFFTVLCKHSKKARIEFLNLLLLIISEGLHNTTSLNKVYGFISNKIDKIINPNSFTIKTYVLSNDCTVDNVGSQCIDCLQHLCKEYTACSKFFTTVHQDLLVAKHRKFSGDNFNKTSLKIGESSTVDLDSEDFIMNDTDKNNSKACPINYLFTALCIPVVRNEVTLMDALSLSIKTIIFNNCVPKKSEKSKALKKKKKNDQLGSLLMMGTFKILLTVVAFESSTTRTLENIINTLQVIKETYYNSDEHAVEIMNLISDMCTKCLSVCSIKLDEMIKLIDKDDSEIITSEDPNDIVSSMSASNSSQSCLLKYITIMDFLFFQKKADSKASVANKVLIKKYTDIAFSKLWLSFSTYLNKFEAKNGNTLNVTKILFLLPLLESVMIDCKINILLNENNFDVSKIGKEFIFEHKILLNSMIRTSPKLMNGPFSILLTLDSSAVDFDNKRFYFKTKLKQNKRFNSTEVNLKVNRSSVFEDSYRVLYSDPSSNFKTGKLNVTFEGEEGVDAGGLTREWYQIISREMVSPDLSLFTPVSEDNNDTFIPNRNSSVNPSHFSYFEFCGMIMAKAVYDSCFLDCHFIRPIYKAIIGKNPGLKDMESIDAEYYKSVVWILENDITDVLDMTFSIETEDSGVYKSHDLIKNGSEIAVTEENKKSYVEKVIDFKLKLSFEKQLHCLVEGFYSIIDKDLIEIFNENELELLLSGLPDIDVDDWKNNTEYVNYTNQSQEISLFWRCVRSFNQVEKAKLLQFITGTSKVPLNGFKDLQGSNGSSKFSIHKDFGSSSRLPQAHTCFNQLDLPSYKTYDEMKRALLVAINEGSEGFGLK